MDRKPIETANRAALHETGQVLLAQAAAITARVGENAQAMSEIGALLHEMARSPEFGELLAIRPGGKRAAVDVIAEHADGSNLSLYAMHDWQSPPSTDIHWHNYWQTLLVVDGRWPDTVWRPPSEIVDGTAHGVAIDRHESFSAGELQTLGPNEPHGWLADEIKRTDKATLLMWSGSAQGKPRVVVDPDTGRLTDEYGFLNPEPGTVAAGGSAVSWSRF
jgi:hypothetical protein